MKFTQALRMADELGLPDLRNQFIEERLQKWNGEKPPCCAIGGANIAAGLFEFDAVITPSDETWLTVASVESATKHSYIPARMVACPHSACVAGKGLMSVRIAHLYDDHEWSRTRIAEWLERVEEDFEMPVTGAEPKGAYAPSAAPAPDRLRSGDDS